MKKTKELLTDLRTKTEGELQSLLLDAKKELSAITLNLAAGKENNTHKVGVLRKKIARMQTIVHENLANAKVSNKDA